MTGNYHVRFLEGGTCGNTPLLLDYMEYLLKELSWDNEKLTAFADERMFNVLTLTKREASELIDQLKGVLAGEAETGEPASAASAAAEAAQDDSDTSVSVAEQPEPITNHASILPIGERATQRQVRALERLVDERGIDLEGELRARFGDRGLADLSMDEAGQLLSEWQQLPRQIRPPVPSVAGVTTGRALLDQKQASSATSTGDSRSRRR